MGFLSNLFGGDDQSASSKQNFNADFGLEFMTKNFPDTSFDCDVEISPDFVVVPFEQGSMVSMTIVLDKPYAVSILMPDDDPDTVRLAYENSSSKWLDVSLRLQDEVYQTQQGERFRPVVADEWKFS